MATRAALTTLIDTNLESGTSITAELHREVEQAIVDSSVPYKKGYFIIPDIGNTTGALTVGGEIASATASTPFANMSKVVVVFSGTAMPTDFYVRTFVKSNSNTAQVNYDAFTPYFTNTLPTGFDFYIREAASAVQSLTFYIEVVPI
jgi:hypothetical protein